MLDGHAQGNHTCGGVKEGKRKLPLKKAQNRHSICSVLFLQGMIYLTGSKANKNESMNKEVYYGSF